MSDPARLCPSCGRRVPSAVAKCRCGAMLPADVAVAAGETTRSSPLPVYLVLMAAVAGVGYWSFMRPPADPIRATAPDALDATAPAGEMAAPSTRSRELTPEQRAWDAAART